MQIKQRTVVKKSEKCSKNVKLTVREVRRREKEPSDRETVRGRTEK